MGVGSIDVSGDFNAEEYDRQMSSIFNEDYLEQREMTKPDFSSFLPPELLDSDTEELHCEDERFVMDADYIEENRDRSQPFINVRILVRHHGRTCTIRHSFIIQ